MIGQKKLASIIISGYALVGTIRSRPDYQKTLLYMLGLCGVLRGALRMYHGISIWGLTKRPEVDRKTPTGSELKQTNFFSNTKKKEVKSGVNGGKKRLVYINSGPFLICLQ